MNKNIKKYKNFYKIFLAVTKNNPIQEKKFLKNIPKKDNNRYLNFCEKISTIVIRLTKKKKINFDYISKAYNDLCFETMREQLIFKKKGEYDAISQKKDNLMIYNSDKKMTAYMLGLLVSQMLWRSHYKIVQWYYLHIKKFKIKKFLEIGPGHGLLSFLAVKEKKLKEIMLCDISKSSINFSKNMIKNYSKKINIKYFIKDFTKKINLKEIYDFVVLGEVIEHVYNPEKILKNLKKIIDKKSVIFLSTCANCPAEDHLYRFKDVKEIRDFLKKNGFKILRDLVSPSENVPKKFWKKEKIAINYCCLLKLN